MIRETVGKYLTQRGFIGVEIQCDEKGRYSYRGLWGAGSGHDYKAMNMFLHVMLRQHPRHQVVINFWGPSK